MVEPKIMTALLEDSSVHFPNPDLRFFVIREEILGIGPAAWNFGLVLPLDVFS